jgi:hypothetical protein
LTEERTSRLETERFAAAEALRQPRSGFRVLSPATVPLLPEKSYRRLVAVALPIVVLFLAMALRVAAVLVRLRPESPAEIAFWGAAPVVASSRWPNDPDGLDDLLADLDAGLSDSHGDTLVLGCAPQDAPVATALVARWEARETVPRGMGALARLVALPTATIGGAAVRRRARTCDRVLVLVRSGSCRPFEVGALRQRLGAEVRIAYVVIDVRSEVADDAQDRVGDVPAYWTSGGARDVSAGPD